MNGDKRLANSEERLKILKAHAVYFAQQGLRTDVIYIEHDFGYEWIVGERIKDGVQRRLATLPEEET